MLNDENGKPVKSANQIDSISQPEQEKIEKFLQGCVYAWCNTKKEEAFCAANFVGGTNKDWKGTPPHTLFNSRLEQYRREYPQESEKQINARAFDQAGKDLGWILKNVLIKDKRTFNTQKEFHSAYYIWDEETDNKKLE